MKTKKNETEHGDLLKRAVDVMNKPVDEFQIFGDFVAAELRNLKSREHQRQLKLTIQRAIIHFSEIDGTDLTTHSTSGEHSNSSRPPSRPLSAASYYSGFIPNLNEQSNAIIYIFYLLMLLD